MIGDQMTIPLKFIMRSAAILVPGLALSVAWFMISINAGSTCSIFCFLRDIHLEWSTPDSFLLIRRVSPRARKWRNLGSTLSSLGHTTALAGTAPIQRRYRFMPDLLIACIHMSQMAKAGFVYTPQSQDDDSASCLYCGILLGGWESEDDPMYVLGLILLGSRMNHFIGKNITNETRKRTRHACFSLQHLHLVDRRRNTLPDQAQSLDLAQDPHESSRLNLKPNNQRTKQRPSGRAHEPLALLTPNQTN
jgi:hypothetical protein